MCDDADAQTDEILALQSIFEGDDDILICDTVEEDGVTFQAGCLKILPNIDNPPIRFTCKYANRSGDSTNETVFQVTHEIEYLPPIVFNFILPKNYPSKSQPQITLESSWLDRTQLSKIAKKIDEIWDEQKGQEVLYNWFQFLQEDLLQFMGFTDEIAINQEDVSKSYEMHGLDSRVMQNIETFSDIVPIVLEHNEIQQKKIFDSTLFECNVCFSEKYGKNCIQFKECRHVYCNECLKSYFNLQIKEGNMKALICPEHDCNSQAYPAQIKQLVSSEDYERYESMLLQTTLDTMNDIMYCPRKFCQSAVVVEPEETIGICSVCKYSFCPYCKLGYHGVEPCRLKQSALKEMCEKYKDADADTKKEMETKYGAKVLRSTIQNLESEMWILNNSKNCPDCSAAIEKKDGCNKMICYKCKCYFCWLCMQRLSRANPYSHYNTSGSKCYNKLFQGVDPEDFDEEEWWDL